MRAGAECEIFVLRNGLLYVYTNGPVTTNLANGNTTQPSIYSFGTMKIYTPFPPVPASHRDGSFCTLKKLS
jgi:hypothetical protein